MRGSDYDFGIWTMSIIIVAGLIFLFTAPDPTPKRITTEEEFIEWCETVGFVELDERLFSCKPMKRPELK